MKSKNINSESFAIDNSMSIAQRIASFLDYAAIEFPRQYASMPLVTKAVIGGRMQKEDSEQVAMVRRHVTRAGAILQEKYSRAIDNRRGLGVRATVDDSDVVQTALPKRMKRLESARQSVLKTSDLIDFAKLPSTPAMKLYTDWVKKDVRDVLNVLRSPEFSEKLLPPPPPAES